MVSIRRKNKRNNPEGDASKDDDGIQVTEFFSSQEPFELDWWHDFSQRISGPLSHNEEDLEKFKSVFMMSSKTFNYICSLVEEDMLAKSSNFVDLSGKPLTLNDQVAVALRRLGSGESLSAVGNLFGMNQSTVNQITWRFVEAVEVRGNHHLSWPSTETEMEEIKSTFEDMGLPNCCGVIDITHILMTFPASDPLNYVWLDHQKNCSMTLQAIVDPDLRFRDIVCGWPGSLSDEDILRSSGFFKSVEKEERLIGNKRDLPD